MTYPISLVIVWSTGLLMLIRAIKLDCNDEKKEAGEMMVSSAVCFIVTLLIMFGTGKGYWTNMQYKVAMGVNAISALVLLMWGNVRLEEMERKENK